MADTDWATLQQRCTDHDATIDLRAETLHGNPRFSLAARPNALIYDIRTDAGDNAPQFVITQMVTRALAEWWA